MMKQLKYIKCEASKWMFRTCEGQKDLIFHQKDLHLCSEDKRKSYGFKTI